MVNRQTARNIWIVNCPPVLVLLLGFEYVVVVGAMFSVVPCIYIAHTQAFMSLFSLLVYVYSDNAENCTISWFLPFVDGRAIILFLVGLSNWLIIQFL